jgi:hypothetical protein
MYMEVASNDTGQDPIEERWKDIRVAGWKGKITKVATTTAITMATGKTAHS